MNEIDAKDLTVLVYCVVAVEWCHEPILLKLLKLVYLVSQLKVAHVLRVPLGDFVEFEKVPKFHLIF